MQRSDEGRCIETMPIKTKLEHLGTSKPKAIKRFLRVERRLQRDSELHNNNRSFMDEYERFGHMELTYIITNKPEYYLLPHPVFKESSTTTQMVLGCGEKPPCRHRRVATVQTF